MSGCNLGELISGLVVASSDVIELEAVELVFQLAHLVAVRFHLRVMAARGLHHLFDDELRVTSNVEAPDPELDDDAESIDEGFILGDVVGGGEVEAEVECQSTQRRSLPTPVT